MSSELLHQQAHNDAPFAALSHLLKASHIASTLKHQAIYRAATVRMADVISRLDGSMNPFREQGEKRESMLVVAVRQLEPIWGQVGLDFSGRVLRSKRADGEIRNLDPSFRR